MSSELAQVESSQMLAPIVAPSHAIEVHKRAVEFIREALEEGRDYGVIPGTGEKKNLLKPGAERLVGGYGLRPEYSILESEVDHNHENEYKMQKWVTKSKPDRETESAMKAAGTGRNRQFSGQWKWQESETEQGVSLGLYRYVICCSLYKGDAKVGEGVGSCSSTESKYIRSPRDSENTVLKMAKKRAFVDAVLTTLGLSDRFTQDVEDITGNKAVVDDSVAMPVDAEFVEEPSGPTVMDKVKEAGFWLRDLGVTPEQFALIKGYKFADGEWYDTILDWKRREASSNVAELIAALTPKAEEYDPFAEANQAPKDQEVLTDDQITRIKKMCGIRKRDFDTEMATATTLGYSDFDAIYSYVKRAED